ncbi:hypothetical protein [Pedobacter sp. L105]|uniref:hypothetical protein n=1 Tax=Pedobacter sp. L105 TaxID=1641871 RepID=UPI00131EB27E|nr:hypothetical protein [Pedobacter sp. L105]
MKTQPKLAGIVLIAAALLFSRNVKAQTTAAHSFRFSLGIDAADPTGNLRIGSNFALGGNGRIQYGVTDRFALTLTGGGFHFFSKDIPGTNVKFNSFGVIRVTAGVKEFFTKNIYFGAEAGVGQEETEHDGAGNTKFLLSPALGYANNRWDFGVHYDHYSGQDDPYGLVGLRVAYCFGL